ncbi:hypothetical protein V1293_005493 [Bradyrhizobium sp. AZCC 1693]
MIDIFSVYFATHGLVAGDVKGLAEPALVLSIPKQPNEFDDGLLTASEVAQLKLNADWVVLSRIGRSFGGRHAALDIDLRPAEGRSQTRPRRGAAAGDAGLSQRCVLAAQCLFGVLEAGCADRRGRRTVKVFGNFLIVRRSNFQSGRAATDGRATTTAKQRKALQQAIDADQPPSLE